MGPKVWTIAAAGGAMFVSACTAPGTAFDHAMGVWGGPHAGADFRGGLADVQFDCASGTIDEPLYPAPDGSFSVKGTYRTGTPGPVKVGQFFKSQAAVYAGRVAKGAAKDAPREMTLSIALEDGTVAGPFALTEGMPPQLTRCL